MKHDNSIIIPHKRNKSDKYYIMYGPSTIQLMGKIGADNFTVIDVVEYLTGKNWRHATKKTTLSF